MEREGRTWKEKGTGYGKPMYPKCKGKGSVSCFTCKGPHLQRDCLQGKGAQSSPGKATSWNHVRPLDEPNDDRSFVWYASSLKAIGPAKKKAAPIIDKEGFEDVSLTKASRHCRMFAIV